MDNRYREHIKGNVDKLIIVTEFTKMINGCEKHGLINSVMRERIENLSDSSEYGKHRELFIKITKRGPNAYNHLKTILNFLNFDKALNVLNEPGNDDSQFISIHKPATINQKPNNQQKRNINNVCCYAKDMPDLSEKENKWPTLELYNKDIIPKSKRTVLKSKIIHYDLKVGHYKMKSKSNRGVFFMVNIIDFPSIDQRRNGAEEDGKSLLYLFRELGFKLFAYDNLTKDEFFNLLDCVINSDYTKNAECFVMALMTHGDMDDDMNDKVQFHDGAIIKVREIEDRFENRKCPNLINKPKIFLFPFCRGQIVDYGHYRDPQTDNISPYNTPTLSDILICHASIRGFKAHRDPVDGAWYIQEFCNVMSEQAHDTDFEDIVKMIQYRAGKLRTRNGGMQMASYTNLSFNKKLFFNPGIYEDD